MAGTKKRREMTPAWKQRVLAVLAANKEAKREPSTLAGLAKAVKADKRGIYVTFETDQTASSYVDAICEVLGIEPPLQEPEEQRQAARDEDLLRRLDPDQQAAVLKFISGLSEAIRSMPPDQQQPLRMLIASFLHDFFATK